MSDGEILTEHQRLFIQHRIITTKKDGKIQP